MSNEKQTILVVDDTADNIHILKGILKDLYIVKAATNGKIALEILEKDNNISLILLDVMMPEMDGYEVCNRIKANENTKKIPIIFITAMSSQNDEAKGLSLGAVDYITKPINPAITLSRIKTHLDLYDYNLLLEMEIEKKDNYIISQSHLATMGEMISMIAHQWRQPLSAISAKMINLGIKFELDDFDLNKASEQDRCILFINETRDGVNSLISTLSNTIDDFRNFYKPDKVFTLSSLENIVKKSINIMSSSFKENNTNIVLACTSVNSKIHMHESEMSQVVLNIFKNSQDNFIEKNIENAEIKIDINNNILKIHDNGGGVPETIMESIFDPYFSTKDEMNGTGLGLYMSKTIVEKHHNGKLHVKNEENGACFVIELNTITEP